MIAMDKFEGEMRVANINLRSERHGEVETPAVDIKLEWVTTNLILHAFHAKMREAFYERDHEPGLPGMDEAMAALIFPELDPLKIHTEETGLTLRIVHGLSGSSDLVLKDCTASGFKLDMLQGGSVEVTFTMATVDIDEKRLGKLGLMLKGDVPVKVSRQDPPQADNITTIDSKKSKRERGTADAVS